MKIEEYIDSAWEKEIPQKVLMLYQAVLALILDGENINKITVTTITQKAQIGKGTAYEYFQSKEEIITSAIFYILKKSTIDMVKELLDKKNFFDRVVYLFENVEVNVSKKMCLMNFIHLLTDNNIYGMNLFEKLKEKNMTDYLPIQVLKHLVQKGLDDLEIKSELPIDYIAYTIQAKLFMYISYLDSRAVLGVDGIEMKEYIYKGIKEEFQLL